MRTIITSLVALALLAGGCDMMPTCDMVPTNYHANRNADIWAITSANDQAVRDALIRQSAIFPYHFIDNSARLNELGASDLDVLVTHFRSHPGRISVRRGVESKKLYDARVAEVLSTLATGGVDTDRVTVVDLPAGGDGMPSDNVIDILKLPAPIVVNTGI